MFENTDVDWVDTEKLNFINFEKIMKTECSGFTINVHQFIVH
jgi:hypothetical protein